MELKHFSHEHPLNFNEEKDIEDEINRDHFCSFCNLPILLSSFYSCSSIGCMYLLHEPCALLPETMSHPWFLDSHFLLREKPPNDDSHCYRCRQSCQNFTYIDDFDEETCFHPICSTVPMLPIKSKHKSHPLHPLVAVGRRTTAVCDACAREQNGYFFMCHQCNFWIHVDCALLPRIIKCKKHDHFLILTYTNYDMYQRQLRRYCLICCEKMFGTGAYSCGYYCDKFIHLSCAIEDKEVVGTETDLGVTYLPAADQSWIIRSLPGIKSDGNSEFAHKLHDHPLILYNDTESSGSSSLSEELTCCDACIQPIYPPFYACSQSSRCHFHLHQLCSGLPSRVSIFDDINVQLNTRSNESLCSLFYCIICCRLGNGLSYRRSNDDDKPSEDDDDEPSEDDKPSEDDDDEPSEDDKPSEDDDDEPSEDEKPSEDDDDEPSEDDDDEPSEDDKPSEDDDDEPSKDDKPSEDDDDEPSEDDGEDGPYIHITCFFPPGVIRHASHKQHVLHLGSDPGDTIKQCCSDPNASRFLYQCFDCHFNIDNRCALLPGKIKHKYDTHPLDLITTSIVNSDDNYICEFCEEHIDTNFWYYGCEECDNLFHVNCIPSVGSLSKVKFGNSINISCHPLHPVTFVRMLGFGSQTCGYCKGIVKGFVDKMAFHCSECDFWMHFKCAKICSGFW